MSARLRSRPFLLISALIAIVSGPATFADDRYPTEGFAPRQKIGGLVSIPGAPLPPISEDSVRGAIVIQRGIVAGARLFGRTAALARSIGFLATLYSAVGENSKAESLFDEAQSILEENGPSGRDFGWLNNNRGLVRLNQHRYADAMRFFRFAVAALKSNSQDLLEHRARAQQNLALAYHLIGDFENSENAYFEALDTIGQLKDKGSDTSDITRVNLAELYGSMRDFNSARNILEPMAARSGLSSSLKFAVLNNLGYVLYALKDTQDAKAYLNRALALTATESHERLLIRTNLSATYFTAGDLDGAQREGEEALRLAEALYGKESSYTAAAMGTLGTTALARGDLQKAARLLMQAIGILAKDKGAEGIVAGLTQELALVAQRRGNRRRAIELSRQALDLEKKNLDRILAFGSEAQRLAYRSNAFPYDQLANLGDATLLADAVLTTKGAVLESLLAERAQARKGKSAGDRERLDEIHALKVELMEKTARGESDLETLQQDLNRQETALATSLKTRAEPLTVRANPATVQAALEGDQVLVEIIRYQLFASGGKNIPSYGGIVIPHRGDPTWVPLGPADVSDELIAGLMLRLDVGSRGMEPPSVVGDVIPTLRELDARLWTPLARAFPAGTRKVVLSPDGNTHFIPWAALLDQNERYLVERWQLTQVDSGRDLLRGSSSTTDKTFLALADGMNNLPHSREEARHLARMAEARGWHTTVLLGEQASEAKLFEHPSPRILHLATHGAQLPHDHAQPVAERLSTNPMYQGALLLGGASESLAAWTRSSVPPVSEDGILTAEEVAGHDFSHTWLTVLSACRTGSGDPSVGEGILGLRRGFMLAGTENLLFSLWSVDDEATARFMEAFYERLFQNEDPVRAFNETQAEELRRWTQIDHDVPTAVFRAGGFVLTR